MDPIRIPASNNAAFAWTADLAAWADLYSFEAGVLRMQMRRKPLGLVEYEWSTQNGRLLFDPDLLTLVASAPFGDVAGFSGDYVFDCRFEYLNNAALIFGGTIAFAQGITR